MDKVLAVNFGSTKTGLGTVGYQMKNADGANSGSRITAEIDTQLTNSHGAGSWEAGGGEITIETGVDNFLVTS